MSYSNIEFMLKIYCALFLFTFMAVACSENNNLNSPPELSYRGMSKDNMNQGSLGLNDTIKINLSFIDLDGDLSGVPNNLVIIDNRLNEVHVTNTIPDLPTTKNGNVGFINVTVPTLCCIFSDGTPACEAPRDQPTNELTFDIYVIDQNGNQSNRVTTELITLFCK